MRKRKGGTADVVWREDAGAAGGAGYDQAGTGGAAGGLSLGGGNYETGVSFPKEEIMLRLFDALETDPNTLFQDSFQYNKER